MYARPTASNKTLVDSYQYIFLSSLCELFRAQRMLLLLGIPFLLHFSSANSKWRSDFLNSWNPWQKFPYNTTYNGKSYRQEPRLEEVYQYWNSTIWFRFWRLLHGLNLFVSPTIHVSCHGNKLFSIILFLKLNIFMTTKMEIKDKKLESVSLRKFDLEGNFKIVHVILMVMHSGWALILPCCSTRGKQEDFGPPQYRRLFVVAHSPTYWCNRKRCTANQNKHRCSVQRQWTTRRLVIWEKNIKKCVLFSFGSVSVYYIVILL